MMTDQQRRSPDETDEPAVDDPEQEPDPEAVDPDVKDIFDEAQELDYGRAELTRKLETYTDRTPELTGGDIDAAWEYSDIGEETVGGQNPTPDQSVVDDAGQAVGLTYRDNEPLAVDDKVGDRDRSPWELNPASTPDYSERVREEFHAPLETLGIAPESGHPSKSFQQKSRAKPSRKRTPRQSRRRRSASAPAMTARSTKSGAKSAKSKSTGTRDTKVSRPSKKQRK